MRRRPLLLALAVVLASCGEEQRASRREPEPPAPGPQSKAPATPVPAAAEPATRATVAPSVTRTVPGSKATARPASSVPARPTTANPVQSEPPRAGRKLARFKRVSCVDRQGIGIEAFSFLAPEGWRFEGGITWPLQNPGMPANLAYTVTSPGGADQLQVFPTMTCFWTNDENLLERLPIGSMHLGSEVRPPQEAADVLRYVIVPLHRRGLKGFRIVEAKALPGLARKLGGGAPAPGVEPDVTAGRLRIEYDLDGRAVEEDLCAAVECQTASTPTPAGELLRIHWVASYLFAFRAPKGGLASQMESFQVMLQSFRYDLQWFNRYSQLTQILVREQIRKIESLSRVQRLLRQTSEEVTEGTRRAWREQIATQELVVGQLTASGRRLAEYLDPIAEQTIKLPAGYGSGWTNGRGEYVVTNDPEYDPSEGSDQKWTPLRR